jgi:hypothetical protein
MISRLRIPEFQRFPGVSRIAILMLMSNLKKEAAMSTKQLAVVSFLTVVSSLAGVGYAMAMQQVSTSFSEPVQVQGSVMASDCSNAPGPQITFDGAMALGGVNVEMIFRNNINKDVHTLVEDVKVLAEVAAGQEIVIPKQPVLGGVGGNPFIWVQFVDTNNNPMTGEIFLGRCVQGPWPVTQALLPPATATAILAVLDCTNNPGPYINVEGSLSFLPGIRARFIFRNNDNPVGGPHEADAMVDLTLMPAGFALQFPKQPVLGGVGGNPWISVQFVNDKGEPIGMETLLGRCVQLLPGN